MAPDTPPILLCSRTGSRLVVIDLLRGGKKKGTTEKEKKKRREKAAGRCPPAQHPLLLANLAVGVKRRDPHR